MARFSLEPWSKARLGVRPSLPFPGDTHSCLRYPECWFSAQDCDEEGWSGPKNPKLPAIPGFDSENSWA